MNWHSIDGRLPVKLYVLIARKSDYSTTLWDFMTASYDPDYKGWVDVASDRLSESGGQPLFWAYLPEAPKS